MSDERDEGRGRPRLETGVQRLDFILKGGLFRGATYAILGPPGSGKTILGNQIAFQHVNRSGGRVLYVTLLSESHASMIENLSSLKFFDVGTVAEKLTYLSGYGLLEREGLTGLLAFVQQNVRQHRPTLFVLDGLDAAGEFAPSDTSFKKFIHQVQALMALSGCTALLLSPTGPESSHPENTSVDGIIELSHRFVGPRAVRELSVVKFRGSDQLLGKHEVEISDQGIVVHPRTEVQFDQPSGRAREDRLRMPFGIERLDAALTGGLLSGSTTTLLGGPGTGKTLLGLQFLSQGAELGQPGVYFGFYETPPRLIEKAEALGIPLEKHVQSGLVEIQWQPPLEHNMDSLAERLLERIHERDVSRERLRVFIDGVAGFRAATVYPERMGRFLSALAHQLRLLDVTTLFSEETPLFSTEIDMPNAELGGAVENVILLRNVELRSELHRLISILKMRESPYDSAIREFSITTKGIRVGGVFEGAEAVLTGVPRLGAGGGVGERASGARKPPAKKGTKKAAKPRKPAGTRRRSR